MGTHCMATWISHHLWQLMSSGRQNRTFANLLQLQGTPGDAVPQYPVLTTYLPLGFLEPDLPLYSVTVCYSSPRRIRVTHFRSGANATLTLSCTLCTHIFAQNALSGENMAIMAAHLGRPGGRCRGPTPRDPRKRILVNRPVFFVGFSCVTASAIDVLTRSTARGTTGHGAPSTFELARRSRMSECWCRRRLRSPWLSYPSSAARRRYSRRGRPGAPARGGAGGAGAERRAGGRAARTGEAR